MDLAWGGTATPPGLAGADYDIDGAASFDPSTHSGTILIPQGQNTALLRVIPLSDNLVEGAETAIVTIQAQPDVYIVGQTASAIVNINEPPPNDAFVNAIVLTGTTPSATGTNAGATKETGEPNHAGINGGKSVWWRWTAPANMSVSIGTAGSNFDTILGVYTGNAVNALTLIAGNDDSGGSVASKVTIAAIAGTTYQIAVDGYGAASGTIKLVFTLPPPPPSNDNFANAIVLTGAAPSTTGTNVGATKETGEPNHAGDAGGHSVWWRWTAPADGYASASTAGTSLDTLLAVYTGDSVDALTEVASNDQANGTNQSQVVFPVAGGVTYQIAVDGWNGAEGNVALAINGQLPSPNAYIYTYDNSASEATGDTAGFYIYLDGAQPQSLPIAVSLGGTATPGGDYTLSVPVNGNTATITFPPGQDFILVTLTPVADNDANEFDETIVPALVAGSGYQIGSSEPAAAITLHDDTPYNAAWTQQFPGFTGPDTAPLADFNGNGVVNLLEFAFNGNPVAENLDDQNGVPLLPVLGFGSYPDPNDGDTPKLYPTLTFNRRTDAPWLTYVVQSCSSLASDSWSSNGAVQVSVATAGLPAGIERVTFRSGSPAEGSGMLTPQFLRVSVSAVPH